MIHWKRLAAIWLMAATCAAEAAPIGETALVQIWANRARQGEAPAPIHRGDGIFLFDSLATVEDGGLIARFDDGTELRLGSKARVIVDEFVYGPAGGRNGLAMRVTGGIARFITGATGGPDFRIETPAATIGVRGTDFSVWVERGDEFGPVAGRTTIWVNSGAVTVSPRAGGPLQEVGSGETVRIAPDAATLERDANRPASDAGLAPRLRPGRNNR